MDVLWKPLPQQDKVDQFYNSVHIQVGVAILIGANFFTNIIEKEIDPHGTKHSKVFEGFELFYNICFTLELAINLYAHYWKQFWRSGWNIFDVVVVSIGLINMMKLPLPSAFSMLRMMRAFRVFRLFKRVHSLNKIIVAIVHAVPGVINAFLILAIVMSIYAILAVEFYYEIGDDCHVETSSDARFESTRGHCLGQEYFGTFSKSFYSFFQVLTGESWSEAVARPTIWYFYDDPLRAVGSGFFFVSYVLVSSFVLTNVVVAVLLDKMVDPEVNAAASPDQAVTDGAEAGDQKDGNGEEAIAKPTPDDLKNCLNSMSEKVDELMKSSEKMSSELDTFKSDMSSMTEQVGSLVQWSGL